VDLLELFDQQLRRDVADEDGLYVGEGWSAVLWRPPDVDRALARLRGLPGHAEWKYYGHDPAGLRERLLAAGLVPDEEEAVLVAEAAAVPAPEVEVEAATTPELVDAFVELAERVFGNGSPGTRAELLRGLEADEPEMLATVVMVDGEAVSGGRLDLPPRSDFAGMFGGITVPEHRGRGYYRATVAKRAELARERGYRYLYVDALPTSRPILERVGFTQLTTTTPFTFPRDAPTG
jgi:GNAT superfamily N-acetyltransferase